MPNTVLEALAAGCAVVGTPVGAVPELLGHGSCGVLVPVGDTAGLTQALERLVTDPLLRARLGQQAIAHAATHYDLRVVETALAAIYDSLVPGVTRPVS